MWHFLISVNILNNKNITSRSIESSSSLPASVGQSVACLLRGMGGHGFISGHDIPKLLKWCSFGTQTYEVELDWSTQYQDNVTGCGIMSSVWAMILQRGSTKK